MSIISEESIRELAAFRGTEAPVTTCYLDVDGRRFVRQQDVEQELEHLVRELRAGPEHAVVADDVARIEEYVKGGFDRSRTRGLAIFSCRAHDLWEVVPLPVPVRSKLVVNHAPAVGQLEQVVQDYERIGVLLVDREHARMLVFELGELTDHSELLEELPRHYDARGHGDAGYEREQHHVEELALKHLKHAAEAAFAVFKDSGYEHLVVGAPDAIFHELEAQLHPYLQERYRGRLAALPSSNLEEIRVAALELEEQIDRQQEAELVERLRAEVGAGGRAVAGLGETLRALGDRRVEHLLVSDGYEESGWHCTSCGLLADVGPTCSRCDTDLARDDDVVEEAVEDALTQGVAVTICVGNADLDVLGRIGALLRY